VYFLKKEDLVVVQEELLLLLELGGEEPTKEETQIILDLVVGLVVGEEVELQKTEKMLHSITGEMEEREGHLIKFQELVEVAAQDREEVGEEKMVVVIQAGQVIMALPIQAVEEELALWELTEETVVLEF
jgi:hypothetical protein